MSDYVHVMYGEEGAYGVVSKLRGVRVGINAYINGFLNEENNCRKTKQITDIVVKEI